MISSHDAKSVLPKRDGSRRGELAELRNLLARPSKFRDGHRQRLRYLVQRLARVQAMGADYRRVCLSGLAASALKQSMVIA